MFRFSLEVEVNASRDTPDTFRMVNQQWWASAQAI
jgi:hypothetical protein